MVVVVGGHSRNIGKTSVAAGIIQAIPEAQWTAVKITQHGHGICSAAGEPCNCAIEYDHPYAVDEETAPNATDSGRFLAAGAVRAYWLRTAVGQLGYAAAELRRIIAASHNAIFESNSVMQLLRPDLYIAVLDSSVTDMKDSFRRNLPLADAVVVVGGKRSATEWDIPERWIEPKPKFQATPPDYAPQGLVSLVRRRMAMPQEAKPAG